MLKLTLLVSSLLVLFVTIQGDTDLFFPCSRESDCTQRLNVLTCDYDRHRCVCQSGYKQDEKVTYLPSGFPTYTIQCSKGPGTVVIVVIVLVVLGLVAGGVTTLVLMKRRRMACFA